MSEHAKIDPHREPDLGHVKNQIGHHSKLVSNNMGHAKICPL
jgi:hypothetical protein